MSATLLGGFTVWIYLDKINQTSILPDIYSSPTALLAITIVFLFYLTILFIIYGLPYSLAFYLENNQFNLTRTFLIGFSAFLFIIPNFLIITASILSIYTDSSHYHPFILTINILIILAYTLYVKIHYRFPDFFSNTFGLAILHNFSSHLYIAILSYWSKNNAFIWMVFISYIANIIFALLFISNYENRQRRRINKWILIIPPSILTILAMYFIFLFLPNSSYKLLRPIHFIEYSDDSAWYLINNNFQKPDGSQEISGIKKQDLNKIKRHFYDPTNPKQFQNRKNALYGYMAWNLGNIKVFCPRQVEFTDNSEKNKQPAKQCLLIDGKYLQILDDQYITSD